MGVFSGWKLCRWAWLVMDFRVPSARTNMVVTGVAPERTTGRVSTPLRRSSFRTISPAASFPRAQRMPVFRPSFAAAIESFTASPPTFREPETARNPDAETGCGSNPLMMESISAIPIQIRS